MKDAAEPKLDEIAASQEGVFDVMLSGTMESVTDLVERVADTGASSFERDVEFAGQVWAVTVRLKDA